MLRKNLNVAKFLTNSRSPTHNWRIRIKQSQLLSQASSILLQRHSKLWTPLLRHLKLSSNFSPSLFHQILNRIQTHPKICLNFFNWAHKNLGFEPDIRAQCEVIRILFGSELSKLGLPILNSIVQHHPPAKIVPLLLPRTSADFHNVSPVLNSVIECYCSKQMYIQSSEVYQMANQYGVRLSVDTCNTLLNMLADNNELKLAWCFYASMIRNGILGDKFTWSVVTNILYKDGEFERISRILDMGIYTPEMFDLMIDGYSKRGDFEIAFDYLNKLFSEGVEPSFRTYSAMLDGACRYKNREVIENVVSFMVEKGHITRPPASNYDLIIKKLCDMGKTYAMNLFYQSACNENIELKHNTYECMFRALLREEGRVGDAIELYNVMQEKNIILSESCHKEFVIAICKENPSHEINNLLVEILRRGIGSPPIKDLSNYISKQCAEGQWREAEELLDLILNHGWLLDSVCCGSFVRCYCSRRLIDKAMVLHNKLVELNGTLETATYNVLVAALFREKRIEEAMEVFDYMKAWERINSESFVVVIGGLCRVKELRKAMKLHDEMLKLGLKPDQKTYKRLISSFR
ncbi:hypothetical protein ACS0TY_032733 [Phlomoides rotata]